jgi:hypothetical protein
MFPAFCWAQQDPSGYPLQFEGDWNLPDFTFQSGETLAPLRLHYSRTSRVSLAKTKSAL